jgi:hypothetical protein
VASVLCHGTGLQKHYGILEALALGEDEMPDIKDETLPDEEGLARYMFLSVYLCMLHPKSPFVSCKCKFLIIYIVSYLGVLAAPKQGCDDKNTIYCLLK